MKKCLLIFLILAWVQMAAAAEISPEKKKLIDRLITQTGQSAAQTSEQFTSLFINSLTQSLKRAKPDIDPRAFDILQEEVKQVIGEVMRNSSAFSEMMYPIYGQRFSEKELNQLIAFYDTPLGKKLLQEQPAIARDGMQAGQRLGQTLAPKIQERIQTRFREEGIELP